MRPRQPDPFEQLAKEARDWQEFARGHEISDDMLYWAAKILIYRARHKKLKSRRGDRLMRLQEVLEQIGELTDKELSQLAQLISSELQERDRRERDEALETSGLIPVYRCQDPEHQRWGLYAESPDRPGYLVCGCPKSQAELAGCE